VKAHGVRECSLPAFPRYTSAENCYKISKIVLISHLDRIVPSGFQKLWSDNALLNNTKCFTEYFSKVKLKSHKLHCTSWYCCLCNVSWFVSDFEQL